MDAERKPLVGLPEAFSDEDATVSSAEAAALAEAEEWLKHGEPIPHEQVLAELGLSMADWDKMSNEPARDQ